MVHFSVGDEVLTGFVGEEPPAVGEELAFVPYGWPVARAWYVVEAVEGRLVTGRIVRVNDELVSAVGWE